MTVSENIPLSIQETQNATLQVSKAVSLKEEIEKVAKKPEKSFRVYPFKVGKSKVQVKLVGEFFTNNIIVSSEYNSHSFGFKFTTPNEATLFDEIFSGLITDIITEELPESCHEWSYYPLFKEENELWLKLKYDSAKTAYKTNCNLKLNPKKHADAPFNSSDAVNIIVEVSTYLNFSNKTYGICLNVKDIQVV